jgi:uncharacterized protein
MERQPSKYMNPYLAGFLLGLVLLSAFYFTREGLGASGANKAVIVSVVKTVAPKHSENSSFYSNYIAEHPNPLNSRLVFMVFGVLIGGFISGIFAGRLKFKVEHSPKITSKTRLVAALIGGILFGVGAQFGRGCTSGAALTGMASLASAGFLTMIFIFGTGYAVAYFFRKLWI